MYISMHIIYINVYYIYMVITVRAHCFHGCIYRYTYIAR